MIKLIAFDLGQVLVNFDIMHAINRIAPFSALDTPTIRTKIFGKPLGIDFELGVITPEMFYQRLCHILQFKNGHDLSYDAFIPIFNEIFSLDDKTIQIMHQLSQTIHIGIISNTNTLHYEYIIRTYHVWDPITYAILSFQVGARKPDKRIYNSLIEKSNLKPEEILMIDDKIENIQGARQAGFDTILFTNADSLRRELTRQNMLPYAVI